MNYSDFMRLLRSSKQYEMNGSKLKMTNYYTGEEVVLDLRLIDEEMFTEIQAEPDEDEEV